MSQCMLRLSAQFLSSPSRPIFVSLISTTEAAERALESFSLLSSVSARAVSRRRKRESDRYLEVFGPLHNVYQGAADVLVPGAKPLHLVSSGIQVFQLAVKSASRFCCPFRWPTEKPRNS